MTEMTLEFGEMHSMTHKKIDQSCVVFMLHKKTDQKSRIGFLCRYRNNPPFPRIWKYHAWIRGYPIHTSGISIGQFRTPFEIRQIAAGDQKDTIIVKWLKYSEEIENNNIAREIAEALLKQFY